MSVAASRRRWRASVVIVVSAAVVLVFGWLAGLMRFAGAIPARVGDRASVTDAIVVLTGGSERLTTGVDLLDQGLARRVFVSGVHPGVDAVSMLTTAGIAEPAPAERIELGHAARDTAGNARETASWLRRHHFRSMRLVTASYHMPRSLLEFRHVLPETTIVPHPVFPGHVKQSRWWAWPGTLTLIIGEYHKFLLSWARHEASRVAVQKRERATCRGR